MFIGTARLEAASSVSRYSSSCQVAADEVARPDALRSGGSPSGWPAPRAGRRSAGVPANDCFALGHTIRDGLPQVGQVVGQSRVPRTARDGSRGAGPRPDGPSEQGPTFPAANLNGTPIGPIWSGTKRHHHATTPLHEGAHDDRGHPHQFRAGRLRRRHLRRRHPTRGVRRRRRVVPGRTREGSAPRSRRCAAAWRSC